MNMIEVARYLKLSELEDWLDANTTGGWKLAIVDSVIHSQFARNRVGRRLYTHKRLGSKRNAHPLKDHYLVFLENDQDAVHLRLMIKNLNNNSLVNSFT
jgi:hypothetical protein